MDKEHDKHRHHHKRHDGWEGSMAASTDIADAHVLTDEEEARLKGEHGHDKKRKPPKNQSARIIAVSIEDGKTKITIAADHDHDWDGVAGYIKAGEGMLARFTVEQGDRAIFGRVDVTIDQLKEHLDDVVLNPSSFPKSSEPK